MSGPGFKFFGGDIVTALQYHCNAQREAEVNPSEVDGTTAFVALLFDLSIPEITEATLAVIRNPEISAESSGRYLWQWIQVTRRDR